MVEIVGSWRMGGGGAAQTNGNGWVIEEEGTDRLSSSKGNGARAKVIIIMK